MSRDAWLTLHILGVVLFLGNIIVTAVWKMLADRTRNPPVVAYAQRLVRITDIVFTGTGVVLIVVPGQVLSGDYGGVFGPLWLTLGWSLFVASGVIWIGVLVPIQFMQERLARRFADGGTIPDRYWTLGRYWAIFGTVATILPLFNLYLMVFKPD